MHLPAAHEAWLCPLFRYIDERPIIRGYDVSLGCGAPKQLCLLLGFFFWGGDILEAYPLMPCPISSSSISIAFDMLEYLCCNSKNSVLRIQGYAIWFVKCTYNK